MNRVNLQPMNFCSASSQLVAWLFSLDIILLYGATMARVKGHLAVSQTLPSRSIFTWSGMIMLCALYCVSTASGADTLQALADEDKIPIRLSVDREPLGELAARLEQASGIDIVVSESLTATPVSAEIEATTWSAVLNKLFAAYSVVAKADAQGHLQRLYLMSGRPAVDVSVQTDEPAKSDYLAHDVIADSNERKDTSSLGNDRAAPATGNGDEQGVASMMNPFAEALKASEDNKSSGSDIQQGARPHGDHPLALLNAEHSNAMDEGPSAQIDFMARLNEIQRQQEEEANNVDTDSDSLLSFDELLEQARYQ